MATITKDINKEQKNIQVPQVEPQIVQNALQNANFKGKTIQEPKKAEPTTVKRVDSGGGYVNPTQPAVIRSGDTGATTGLQLPNGRTFLNLPPGHVQALLAGYNQQQAQLAGSIEMKDFANQQSLRREIAGQAGAFEQLGDYGTLTQPNLQTTPLNTKEALLSAISPSTLGAAAGGIALFGGRMSAAAGKATSGAVAGGALGGPYGALFGALSGLSLGIYSNINNNIKSQKRDNITAMKRTLDEGKQNLADIRNLIESDPANASKYLDVYNKQLSNIYQSYRQLKYDTSSNLNLYLGQDGTTALAEYEAFYSQGGELDIIQAEIQQALLNPDLERALTRMMYNPESLNIK